MYPHQRHEYQQHLADTHYALLGATQARIQSDVKYFLRSSTVVDQSAHRTLPRFDRSELILGKLLGSGAFSDAYEIKAFDLPSNHDDDDDDEQDELGVKKQKVVASREAFLRQQMNDRCKEKVKGKRPYVVKRIQPKFVGRVNRFKSAAVDLIVEAHLLASLHHPHILSIRGWSTDTSYADGRHDSFFLVLDRLDGTLANRINEWRKQVKVLRDQPTLIMKILQQQYSSDSPLTKKECVQDLLFAGRLKVIRDVASALAYLHSKGLVYRDLKPQNIGFDVHGQVKLFDFGLVRELPDAKQAVPQPAAAQDEDEEEERSFSSSKQQQRKRRLETVFDMTSRNGTIRYMSPEVSRGAPYNQKVDVYSLALVTWQVMALKKPFPNYNEGEHKAHVVLQGERPSLNNSLWPLGVRTLLFCSWAQDMSIRPTMAEYHGAILRELERLRNGRQQCQEQ